MYKMTLLAGQPEEGKCIVSSTYNAVPDTMIPM